MNLTDKEIIDLYVDQKKSAMEIHKSTGTPRRKIDAVLKENNIQRRSRSEFTSLRRVDSVNDKIPLDELRFKYEVEQWSVSALKNHYGVNDRTIIRRLTDMGIRQRTEEEQRATNFSKQKFENVISAVIKANTGKISIKKIPLPPKEDLKKYYTSEQMTSGQIAHIYQVSDKLILNWLDEYKIPRRGNVEYKTGIQTWNSGLTKENSEIMKEISIKNQNPEYHPRRIPIPPKEELEELYINQRTNTEILSDKYKVCNHTIVRWLEFYDIPLYPKGELQKINVPPREELYEKYKVQKIDSETLGIEYNCSNATVLNWLKYYGIHTHKEGKPSWNFGFTKNTHPSLMKTSITQKQLLRDGIIKISSTSVSMSSQDFCWRIMCEIYEAYPGVFKEIYFHEYNYEFSVITECSKYWLDFYIADLGLVIEYDGEYWHSDPQDIENDKFRDWDIAQTVPGIKIIRIPSKEANSFDIITAIEERIEEIKDK